METKKTKRISLKERLEQLYNQPIEVIYRLNENPLRKWTGENQLEKKYGEARRGNVVLLYCMIQEKARDSLMH